MSRHRPQAVVYGSGNRACVIPSHNVRKIFASLNLHPSATTTGTCKTKRSSVSWTLLRPCLHRRLLPLARTKPFGNATTS